MMSQLERRILEIVAKNHLVTKNELKTTLKIDTSAIETAAWNLTSKKLIAIVNPVGATCYAITKQGMHLLQEMND